TVDKLSQDAYLDREKKLGMPDIGFGPLRSASRWLFYCQPELSLEVGSTGEIHSWGDERFSSWYLPPQQQLIGYFIFSSIGLSMFISGLLRADSTGGGICVLKLIDSSSLSGNVQGEWKSWIRPCPKRR
ncbi:hypothetical protein FOZ61_004454, partial [Perkinsus olseni]